MGEATALTMALRGPEGELVEGRLRGIRFEARRAQLEVEFASETPPDLTIGQVVRLRASGEALERDLEFPGRTTFRSRGSTSRTRFQIGIEEAMALDVVGGRRQNVRIRPDGADVLVTLTHPATGETCRPGVCDLSTTGIGLLLSLQEEARFTAAWSVQLAIDLPSPGDPIERDGDVRYRTLEGASIRLGIAFGEAGGEAADEAIRAFVTARRAELLELVERRSDADA